MTWALLMFRYRAAIIIYIGANGICSERFSGFPWLYAAAQLTLFILPVSRRHCNPPLIGGSRTIFYSCGSARSVSALPIT